MFTINFDERMRLKGWNKIVFQEYQTKKMIPEEALEIIEALKELNYDNNLSLQLIKQLEENLIK